MSFDIVVTNGFVIDGTGSPWFRADVGIHDGRITSLGSAKREEAARVVDAKGLYVTPGFVDLHSHGDHSLLTNPEAKIKIHQGITTQLDGNCGMSIAPIRGEAVAWAKRRTAPYGIDVNWESAGEFLGRLRDARISLNTALLVGHGTVRLSVMGYENRRPDPRELGAMKDMVDRAMLEGCIGMSTGLVYPPGIFADIDEIVALCEVVGAHGGIYTSHVRGDRETQIESAREFLETLRRSDAPGIFSHIEAKYPKHAPAFQSWKLAMLDEARSRGIDVTADTHDVEWIGVPDMRSILPFPWREMTGPELCRTLTAREERERLIADFQCDPQDARARGGPFGLTQNRAWNRVKVYRSRANPEIEDMSIESVARQRGQDPENTLVDLFLEEQGEGPFLLLRYIESDLPLVSRHPLVAPVMTDLFTSNPDNIVGDAFDLIPEWLGIFPDYIRKVAIDHRYVSLEESIRKITSLPMRMMRIWDRGIIRPGNWADLVIFDAERLACGSSLERPKQNPEGITCVIVNGEIVVEDGVFTGRYPGRILTRA